MDTPSDPSTDDLPPYARPTAASVNRRISNTQKVRVDGSSSRQAISKVVPYKSPELHVLRGYLQSTASWRSKAHWLGPFRFFDLPPELRNRIYEYLGLNEASRFVNLCHTRCENVLSRLPPPLAVNRQMCDEAGSYYFRSRQFTFLIYSYQFDVLMALLKAIGTKNRERLANIRNVDIRLAFPLDKFTKEEWPVSAHVGFGLRNTLLKDAAHVLAMRAEFESLTQKHPMLEGWRIQCHSTSTLLWHGINDLRYSTPRRASDIPVPISYFKQLRSFFKGICTLLDGTERVVLDEEIPRLWCWEPWDTNSLRSKRGKQLFKIKPPSGARFYIDPTL